MLTPSAVQDWSIQTSQKLDALSIDSAMFGMAPTPQTIKVPL